MYLFPEAWVNSPWSVILSIINDAEQSAIVPTVVMDISTGGEVGVDESTVDVFRFPLAGRPRLGPMLRLRRLVLDADVDVIHIVDSGPSMLTGTLLSILSQTPLLVHFHSIPTLWGLKKRITLRGIGLGVGAIVGVSAYVSDGIEQHIGIDERIVTYVHNGVDIHRFSPEVNGTAMRALLGFSDEAIAVIEPARFWYLKRQDVLVRAVAIARRTDPRIELALVGWDDPAELGLVPSFRMDIEALAKDLGVSDVVRCYDANARAPEIHAAADIVCLPSLDEPFGLIAPEAQATGKPFVGARSGALAELIADGFDGLLVPPDVPEALAAALVRLSTNDGLRAELGRQGRARAVRDFNTTLLSLRFGAIYRAILTGDPLP
jgi:glycosyltransferase involved in cell wall biosynthesis